MNSNCLICSSDTYTKMDRQGRTYHFCTNCQFITLDQSLVLPFDQERERYELHNNSSDNEGYKLWLKSFIDRAVRPYINHKSRILDFGSGPNPLLQKILNDDGYKIDIYDKHFYTHPFSGLYDMIISTEVIEHIYDPLKQVGQLKSHLNLKGFLALKTSLRPLSDDAFLTWWYKEDRTHISFLSLKAIDIISRKTGLQVYFCDNRSIIIFRN